ncbi:MAG: hypothetical protein MNPFHGCM_01854 [Gemmatimonadaceae bacterium]|nr:hypothetical protein [Gemmatimonadaceae bacterium]
MRRIVTRTGAFGSDEVEVALELFDLGVASEGVPPLDPDYRWVGAVDGDALVAVTCFGPTPATDGTFDLYWLVVDPAHQGRGIGRSLLQEVERTAAADGGRLLVVEASSRRGSDSARVFYVSRGYTELATLRDFYRRGDSRVILARRLT